MRLLYVHRGYHPLLAGAERMTQCLAEAMRQRGHAVMVLCRSASGTVERQDLDNGVEIIGTPTLEPARVRTYFEAQPDVVHAVDAVWPEYPQIALVLAREWGAPFALTPASAMGTWRNRAATLAVCRAADQVFVLTEAEREQFSREGLSDDRLVVVGQGPYLVGQANPRAFRSRYQVAGPMILFLGRKMRSKGYALLLAATADIWREHPDAHFVFIGPRWDPDCLELFAAYPDPRILEIGVTDEIEKHNALAACDMVCVPSSMDVFPLVYVEAWACGKPVIASTFAGSEKIVHHGHNGLLADPDPSSIAEAIRYLLTNESARRAMGQNGLNGVRERFNWQVVADRVETTYQHLINQHKQERDG